jgi:aminotransferase/cystathionine beta-lyase
MKKNNLIYNFDIVTNRNYTDSIKWDLFSETNPIPLWVADMDFEAPKFISECIHERARHKIFGYTHEPANLKELICSYILEKFNWKINSEWIVITPNVVSSLYMITKEITKAGDYIIVPSPIYEHLTKASLSSGQKHIKADLTNENGRLILKEYTLNKIKKNKTKLLMFCNPQNPGGTVYKKNELLEIINFCLANDISICSDEIHSGLILDQFNQHIPIASLSKDISKKTVTLMSMNKTFNISGIGLGWAIIENPSIRNEFKKNLNGIMPSPNIFGYLTTQATLKFGDEWRNSLIEYLKENRNLVYKFIHKTQLLSCNQIEAGYLAWINCEKLALKDPFNFFLKSGVALSPGVQFNAPNHVRLNFATQKKNLKEALKRMEFAMRHI